jgi:hypothetical protein
LWPILELKTWWMGGECGSNGTDQRCIENFSRKPRRNRNNLGGESLDYETILKWILKKSVLTNLKLMHIINKKVKFSLCLINQVPFHEDVWGSGGITPPFLTSVLEGGELSASLDRALGGPQRRYRRCGERNLALSLIEPRRYSLALSRL